MDIPGRRVQGDRDVVKVFAPGPSSAQRTVEQIGDNPVGGSLQGFPSEKNSLQRTVAQNVNIPAGGGLHGFLPDPGASKLA